MSVPLRIAMVSEHASPLAVLGGADAGGQNVHVACLATELGRRGHQVVVHTRRDDPDLPVEVPLAGRVRVHHVDAGPPHPVPKDELLPAMDAFAAELVAHWRADPPDVVHAHFWMSGYAAVRAAAVLGVPVVHTFHALGAVKRRHQGAKDTSPPERAAIERSLLRSCARIIATCSDEVFELRQLGGAVDRIRIVPCGVDPEVFRPDGPTEAVDPGRRRLLSVGRLVERKGIGTLIEALAAIPDTELVVVGGPAADELDHDPDAARLRSIAEVNGMADRVELRGRVDRAALPAIMRSADAVVCLPWYEPFGIVPLEAMACGVPVVAAAVGGIVDTVVDGRTGRLVPPRDPVTTAAVVRELLDDRRARDAFGRAAIRRVRGRYSWDRVAAVTERVYAEVAQERHRRPSPRAATGSELVR